MFRYEKRDGSSRMGMVPQRRRGFLPTLKKTPGRRAPGVPKVYENKNTHNSAHVGVRFGGCSCSQRRHFITNPRRCQGRIHYTKLRFVIIGPLCRGSEGGKNGGFCSTVCFFRHFAPQDIGFEPFGPSDVIVHVAQAHLTNT